MSKSLGNVIDSQEFIGQYGAEILRLWVAAADYTEDIRISDEILKRLVEAYRRIRNTGRFILGNLYDFDPAKNKVAYRSMAEIDRWILHRLQDVIRRVRDAYDRFQFHVVYSTLYNFCTVDLSALYLDVLKDRLYTSKTQSAERRSAQSAFYIIIHTMARLLAPILAFTAEEIWTALPGTNGKEVSVHLTQLPEADPAFMDTELMEKWEKLVALKGEISKAIETARQNKVVGHSLDATIDLMPPADLRSFLENYAEDIRILSIVSQINITDKTDARNPYQSTEFEGLTIGVARAAGEKCNRCWNYSESVGRIAEHPDICDRCAKNLD